MTAFKGITPFSPELQGAWGGQEQKSKYGSYDPSPLMALAPSNAPAARQPAVASRGALQAPPTGGEPMPAFSPGDEGKGVGEARKPKKGTDFFGMWEKGDAEDRDAVAENMADVFGQKGLSLEGATKMIYDQGGEMAARIGEKYGLVPPADKAGMPAFKTQEQAVADVEKGIEEKEAKKKKRQAMGGFLMEVGLRILASNRDDAGGAIAEGALGTMESRRQRKEQEEMKSIATAEMERKAKLEERAETRAEKGLGLEERRTAAEEKRAAAAKTSADAKAAADRKDRLEKITTTDGEVLYVDPAAGWVKDPESGERIREATIADLSAAQIETNRRAWAGAVARNREKIGAMSKTELKRIGAGNIYDLTGQEKEDAIRQLAEDMAKQDGYVNVSSSGGNDDPLGFRS